MSWRFRHSPRGHRGAAQGNYSAAAAHNGGRLSASGNRYSGSPQSFDRADEWPDADAALAHGADILTASKARRSNGATCGTDVRPARAHVSPNSPAAIFSPPLRHRRRYAAGILDHSSSAWAASRAPIPQVIGCGDRAMCGAGTHSDAADGVVSGHGDVGALTLLEGHSRRRNRQQATWRALRYDARQRRLDRRTRSPRLMPNNRHHNNHRNSPCLAPPALH